jgi:hypothetical protein
VMPIDSVETSASAAASAASKAEAQRQVERQNDDVQQRIDQRRAAFLAKLPEYLKPDSVSGVRFHRADIPTLAHRRPHTAGSLKFLRHFLVQQRAAMSREMLLFLAEYSDRLAHFFLQSILHPTPAADLSPEVAALTENLFSNTGTRLFNPLACLPFHLLAKSTPADLDRVLWENIGGWNRVSIWTGRAGMNVAIRRWCADVDTASSSADGVAAWKDLPEDELFVLFHTVFFVVDQSVRGWLRTPTRRFRWMRVGVRLQRTCTCDSCPTSMTPRCSACCDSLG